MFKKLGDDQQQKLVVEKIHNLKIWSKDTGERVLEKWLMKQLRRRALRCKTCQASYTGSCQTSSFIPTEAKEIERGGNILKVVKYIEQGKY